VQDNSILAHREQKGSSLTQNGGELVEDLTQNPPEKVCKKRAKKEGRTSRTSKRGEGLEEIGCGVMDFLKT